MRTPQTSWRLAGLSISAVLAVAVSFAGCSSRPNTGQSDNFFRKIFDKNTYSIYRQNIQQGNAISSSKFRQLHRNMTREQVLYLLGTPITRNAFHKNRWHYYYYLISRDGTKEYDRLTLFFEDNLLIRYRASRRLASMGKSDEKPAKRQNRHKVRE